jgi:hypothetical protein
MWKVKLPKVGSNAIVPVPVDRIANVVGGEFRVRVWGSKQDETEVGGSV